MLVYKKHLLFNMHGMNIKEIIAVYCEIHTKHINGIRFVVCVSECECVCACACVQDIPCLDVTPGCTKCNDWLQRDNKVTVNDVEGSGRAVTCTTLYFRRTEEDTDLPSRAGQSRLQSLNSEDLVHIRPTSKQQ
jgi:hypothetical protein